MTQNPKAPFCPVCHVGHGAAFRVKVSQGQQGTDYRCTYCGHTWELVKPQPDLKQHRENPKKEAG